jgi:hypothetical protein
MLVLMKINLKKEEWSMKKIILATAITSICSIGFIGTANADSTFVGATAGKTWSRVTDNNAAKDNLDHSDFKNAFNQDNTWGARVGRDLGDRRFYVKYDYTSGAAHHNKLVQQNLVGSADYLYLVNDSGTRLFAGVSAGVNKLENNTAGYGGDSSYGFTYGAQVGVLQSIGSNFEVEGGFKYMLNNNNVDFRENGVKVGTADLKNNKQLYLGLNYHF